MFDIFFFFSSRRRHTRLQGDWSSDVCSSDLLRIKKPGRAQRRPEQAPRMSAPASWRLRGCKPAGGQACFVVLIAGVFLRSAQGAVRSSADPPGGPPQGAPPRSEGGAGNPRSEKSAVG